MERAKDLQQGLYVVLSLLVIVILVSGCQGQPTVTNVVSATTPTSINTPTPTPQPTPTLGQCTSALLPGHLLLQGATDIHELTCTPAGTVQDRVISTGVGFDAGELNPSSIAISPDRRFLRATINSQNIDSTSFKIISQDLQTEAKHTYQLSGDSNSLSCVSWSPSNTQVSYVTKNGLILENLITGNHRVLVQEPSMKYSPPGTFPGQLYFGAIDCGAWVSDDILLFHRFTGPFPEQITVPGTPELAPNTTTLALLRDGTLVDTTGASLHVRILSQDGAYVLLAGTDKGGNTDGSWKLAKASAFTSFSAARPISCEGIHCTLLGFVPHSNEVFGFQYDPSQLDLELAYSGLVFVTPQSLTAQLGSPRLPASTAISVNTPTDASAQLEVLKWGGSPNNVIVIYEFKKTTQDFGIQNTQDYFAVTSLQSGETDWLVDATIGSQLLGWIP